MEGLMAVWIRIFLYIVAGWLYGSGLIEDQVKAILVSDPAVVSSIEAALSALIAAVPILWWRIAKRLGWAT